MANQKNHENITKRILADIPEELHGVTPDGSSSRFSEGIFKRVPMLPKQSVMGNLRDRLVDDRRKNEQAKDQGLILGQQYYLRVLPWI